MGLTPMMRQYLEVKEKCKDAILFFRLGDFYEMFFEDAETASRELELVLTGRDCGLEKRAPMCGIPFHAANSYISRLVSRGYKVAICEQMEDPSQAKGIVKRDIIKIVTPGTYTDSAYLEENKNSYLMCVLVSEDEGRASICASDISTGEFNATECSYDVNVILDEISKFNPKEMLLSENCSSRIREEINGRFDVSITTLNNSCFENHIEVVERQFKDIETDSYPELVLKCSAGLINYICDTQKSSVEHINEFEFYSIVDYLSIDINSRRNLELTESLREKTKKGSLLWVLDETSTAMGARMLRKWVEQPLLNKQKIDMRLNAVEELLTNFSRHEDLKEVLKGIYDIERLVGKVSSKNVNAKEMVSLKNSIDKLPEIKNMLSSFDATMLKNMHEDLDDLRDIYDLLHESIMDSPALSVKEGNIIREGYSAPVDELRNAKAHGKEWIANLESREREVTGIKSLKVGYNKVFGYFIEITKSNFDSVPEGRYIRKQTLANAERYITPELKEMEEKILGAEEKLMGLEYDLFVSIRDEVAKHMNRMKKCARMISELDCLSSLATVAFKHNYTKPETSLRDHLKIVEGRHPVIERMIPTGTFVSNDTVLDNEDEQLLLITGPNMAGKSTYMRQVALITLMAQMGSFVPAKEACISICDKIFTRIGASDDLASGKSTFMVEMWEVSNILENATSKSLILLDEVGRGTSTYDGLSIAWSVIEYICNNPKLRCKTLFATHYHELTALEGDIKGVKNYSVSVKEMGSDIIFLRKIVRGGADQSYGIEVAKLAGLPQDVIARAKEILETIEGKNEHGVKLEIAVDSTQEVCEPVMEHQAGKTNDKNAAKAKHKKPEKASQAFQLGFEDLEKNALLEELKEIDVLNMTPMDGFNKLYELMKRARNIN